MGIVKVAAHVEPAIRDRFNLVCKLRDTSMSKVVKKFILNYLSKYEEKAVASLNKKIKKD